MVVSFPIPSPKEYGCKNLQQFVVYRQQHYAKIKMHTHMQEQEKAKDPGKEDVNVVADMDMSVDTEEDDEQLEYGDRHTDLETAIRSLIGIMSMHTNMNSTIGDRDRDREA